MGYPQELADKKFDAVICTYAIHHLTLEQKIALLQQLLAHLNPGGQILLGDVAFETQQDLEECRTKDADAWDDEEIYLVADEIRQFFPDTQFEQISYCAGVVTIQKEAIMNQFSQYIHYRSPLAYTYKKLTQDKQLNVVYFGGSITNGYGSSDKDTKSWRALSGIWLKKHFPQAQINTVNSAIGESGTYLGAYRLERDVLSQHPDLLFIEYAVNDLTHGASRETAAMQLESIIREVKAQNPLCNIVIILTEEEHTAWSKDLYPAAQGHEDIAIAYGLSSIWVGKALASTISPDNPWSKYFIDIVHPNDAGYAFYYHCVEEYLRNSLLGGQHFAEPLVSELPPQISTSLLDGDRCYITELPAMNGFMHSEETYIDLEKTPYVGYLFTQDGTSEFEYDFWGTEMGIYSNFSHYKFQSRVEYSINGREYHPIRCSEHNPTLIVADLPEGQYHVKIRPLFEQGAPDTFQLAAIFTRNAAKATHK